MVSHGPVVFVVGQERPALSVSWSEEPFSGFIVFFSEFDPADEHDETPTTPVCLHCLLDDGDDQLARGLDLARRHGQVDWDGEAWFVPDKTQIREAQEMGEGRNGCGSRDWDAMSTKEVDVCLQGLEEPKLRTLESLRRTILEIVRKQRK